MTALQAVPAPRDDHDRLLSSREVTEHAGITYRQLDYWTRRGYITSIRRSAGTGDPRRYTAADAEAIRILRLLIDAGLSVEAAARALQAHYRGSPTFTLPLTPDIALIARIPTNLAAV